MSVISVASADLAYTMEGDGDPVMLIAGLSGRGSGWTSQTERFATEFTVVVPDHPGTGDSAMPPEMTLEHHALALAEAIRVLDLGPTHIVGSSTGGAIALLMALDHPDVARSISLVSSWARADDFFRHQFAVRKATLERLGSAAYAELTALFLYSPRYLRDSYPDVRSWIETAANGSAETMSRRIDMILAHDVADRLGDIEVPTLVLVGSEDGCTPPYLSRQLAEAIPDAHYQTLEGGHLIYKESPEQFHQVVRDFIAGI